ncbi:MAG: hypothetical protein FWE48_00710 [Coriobacteriia bacterium]|nr:hypothetical protein [Coriobacteriia bacterium]MCL2745603.1 hypothetical protein [Coriobacteriia bacterium]MCL2871318.1 hypothetical protein [Coriobacteriia bacterium]
MDSESKLARIAAVDIGTMSTRLMVVDVIAGQDGAISTIREIYRDLRITQLGLGMTVNGQLSSKGIASVLEALEEYLQLLEHFQVDDTLCVATSAIRDAKNAEKLLDGAARRGIDVVVIPGEVEAQLAFLGATAGASDGIASAESATNAGSRGHKGGKGREDKPTLVVDSGGGSTEFALGRLGHTGRAEILALDSMQIGSRRLTDMFIDSDPPRSVEVKGIRSYLQKVCSFDLKKYVGQFDRIVAVAGTATTLAAVLGKIEPYSPEEIQGYKVTREDLEELLQLFVSRKLASRQKIIGLEPKRAGVIVAGTLILEAVLDALECEEFFVSDRDLLYGIILSAIAAAPMFSD